MPKDKRQRVWASKSGRTLQQVVNLLLASEAKIAAFRPTVEAAINAVYEGHPDPLYSAHKGVVFRGSYWKGDAVEGRRLAVYSFGWTDHNGKVTRAWSHNFYDGPDDWELILRVGGCKSRLNPVEEMIWLSEWEGLVGMELAPKVEAMADALYREHELYGRRGVIMRYLSRALSGYDSPYPRYEQKGGVRYQVGAKLFVSTPNGLVHGDPDTYVTVDPETNIYPQSYMRLASYELQERARKGSK